ERIGRSVDFCEDHDAASVCDSIEFILQSSGKRHTVVFGDPVDNFRSSRLFYPDIACLPYKISGVGRGNNTMTLEWVLHGKHLVDSLIQLYSYDGYKQLYTEDVVTPSDREDVMELMDRIERVRSGN